MIYHNTIARTAQTACARFSLLSLKTTHLTHWKPLRMAQMISEAVNRYAAGCLASGFSAIPYLTAKKTKNMTFTKTVNGQAIYCRIVKRWRGIGAQPWPGDQRGWNPFARTPIRDRARSVLYIHRVALLPLNLRTVSPIYGETSKCALLLFLVL